MHNQVVSVTLPSGWSEASNSNSTDLILIGPQGIISEFYAAQVSSSDTLANELQNVLAFWQKGHADTTVCQAAQSASVPNGPSGQYEGLCLTFTSQNGQAEPYKLLYYVGLAKAQSGGSQLLCVADVRFPQGTSNQALNSAVGSLWNSVHWLQLSS